MAFAFALSRCTRVLRSTAFVHFRPSSTSGAVQTRRRGCALCDHNLQRFGYKDVLLLRQFLSPQGMLLSRRQTRICPKMQKRIAKAIRRSRKMGLLPNFSQQQSQMTEHSNS